MEIAKCLLQNVAAGCGGTACHPSLLEAEVGFIRAT